MASNFSQNFTLKDIFTNKKLKNIIPLIDYKEEMTDKNKISTKTNIESITGIVYNTSLNAATPYYRPIKGLKSANIVQIGGTLVGDIDDAVNAVYSALLSQKQIISYTCNNMEIIRDALKEGEKFKRQSGFVPKLYLRQQSMQQIEGMNKKQTVAFLNDIMENIIFGDNFPKTQKKYGVQDFVFKNQYNYEQNRLRWKFKVGDV